MRATNHVHVAATIEVAFLVLAEAVVVLVGWRCEGCADLEERGIRRPAVVQAIRVAVFVVGDGHLPAFHPHK